MARQEKDMMAPKNECGGIVEGEAESVNVRGGTGRRGETKFEIRNSKNEMRFGMWQDACG